MSTNDVIQVWAQEQKIPWVARQDDLLSAVDGRPVDYLFSIANLSLVPASILALPRLGAINFHDGPLPRYAGLHATTWAILNQETSHGVTWHEMKETVDAGAILKQSVFALAPDDTAFTLNRKCFMAGIDSFEELVRALADGALRARPQDLSQRTYFAKHARPAAQACIDWALPAEHIAAFVRSLDFGPYPNPLEAPKAVAGGHVLLVPELEVLPAVSASAPGTVLDVDGDAVRVATSTTEVFIPRLLTLAGETLDHRRDRDHRRFPLRDPPTRPGRDPHAGGSGNGPARGILAAAALAACPPGASLRVPWSRALTSRVSRDGDDGRPASARGRERSPGLPDGRIDAVPGADHRAGRPSTSASDTRAWTSRYRVAGGSSPFRSRRA